MQPVTTTGSLLGVRAVVTGGARGIGGGIARLLAEHGADVAVLDRLPSGRDHARAIGGTFHEVDLADPAATTGAMTDAIQHLGGVDVLVNCAGVLQHAPLLDVDVAAWDAVFAVNTRAMLLTMQAAARSMIADGGGKIVNIASMAALRGGAGEGAYPASKAAVVALTRVAALEWGVHGITANAICPGYVLTEMGAATRTDEMVAEWSALSPLGRLGTVDDVAALALFLASPASDYLTGQAIDVAGGMVAR